MNPEDKDITDAARTVVDGGAAPTPGLISVPDFAVSTLPVKKKTPIVLIVVLVTLLVAGASVGGFFAYRASTKKSTSGATPAAQGVPKASPSPISTPVAETPKPYANAVLYSIGNKLMAFDTKTEKPTTLKTLPEKAWVMSAYHDDTSWRLIYEQYSVTNTGDTTYAFTYVDSTGTETKLTEGPNIFAAANANTRKVIVTAMTTEKGVFKADAPSTTIAYSVGIEPVEIYQADNSTDLKSAHYTVDSVSPDGTRALFMYHPCFNCDGGGTLTFFELDLSTHKVLHAYEDAGKDLTSVNMPRNTAYYSPTGEVIFSASNMTMDGGPETIEGVVARVNKSDKTTIVRYASKQIRHIALNTDSTYALTRTLDASSGSDFGSKFGGIYKVGSSDPTAWATNIADMSAVKGADWLSVPMNDCILFGGAVPAQVTGYQDGAICGLSSSPHTIILDSLSDYQSGQAW